MRNWPWAPMLNSPALKASATERPAEDERGRGDQGVDQPVAAEGASISAP